MNDEPLFIIKSINPEHAQDYIENGAIHFKSAEYFINLEDDGSGAADSEEGTRVKFLEGSKTSVYFREVGDTSLPTSINFNHGKLKHRYSNIKYVGVACFTSVSLNDLDKISENQFKIKEKFIDGLKSINKNRMIVIVNYLDWINVIETYANKNKLNMCGELVKYYQNSNEDLINLNEYQKRPYISLFYKRLEFSKQREFRLLLNEQIGDGLTIKFGEFSDDILYTEDIDDMKNIILKLLD